MTERCMTVHDIDVRVGKNLCQLREVFGISQKKLCDMISVSQARLSDYENGRVGMGKDIMVRICNALGVDPHVFLLKSEGEEGLEDYNEYSL